MKLFHKIKVVVNIIHYMILSYSIKKVLPLKKSFRGKVKHCFKPPTQSQCQYPRLKNLFPYHKTRNHNHKISYINKNAKLMVAEWCKVLRITLKTRLILCNYSDIQTYCNFEYFFKNGSCFTVGHQEWYHWSSPKISVAISWTLNSLKDFFKSALLYV